MAENVCLALGIVNIRPRCADTNESGLIRFFFPNLALVAIALCCGGGPVAADVAPIDFADFLIADSRAVDSSDGKVSLQWAPPAAESQVELQQAPSSSFTEPVTRHTGSEEGSVLTGLAEGSHFFRLRTLDPTGRPGPWSEALEVRVVFMNRGQLSLLLVLGGVVVVMTIGAILSGHLRTRSNN